MGRVVAETIKDRKDCMVVAGFDVNSGVKENYPVMSDPAQLESGADVIIDFSHPSFLPKLLDFAVGRRIPAVIATTGMNDDNVRSIQAASAIIPVFFSANMSLGVNLIAGLAKKAVSVLGGGFDVEIVEMHHNKKVDAPSGTALMLADEISSAMENRPEYVYDRHCRHEKRKPDELGIHSVRGGTIVGEHEIIFAGNDEVITIKHSAMSKQIFATGAVNAALFLAGREPGLYDMGDLVESSGG